jgi:hypothetical protein
MFRRFCMQVILFAPDYTALIRFESISANTVFWIVPNWRSYVSGADLQHTNQDASEVPLRCMRILSPCRLGRCCKYQRGGTRLASLLVIFGRGKPVVAGTHRRYPRLAAEPVGIPLGDGRRSRYNASGRRLIS